MSLLPSNLISARPGAFTDFQIDGDTPHWRQCMIKTRIRLDGVRELIESDDGVAIQIPLDHEIAPDSAFAIACRDEFFAQFLSTGRSDWVRFEALRCVAAIHDILSIRAGAPEQAARLLDKAVDSSPTQP
jgi:hypothetical protein